MKFAGGQFIRWKIKCEPHVAPEHPGNLGHERAILGAASQAFKRRTGQRLWRCDHNQLWTPNPFHPDDNRSSANDSRQCHPPAILRPEGRAQFTPWWPQEFSLLLGCESGDLNEDAAKRNEESEQAPNVKASERDTTHAILAPPC